MITITLSEEQAAGLRTVLESYLSDLRMEISDTDSYDFRAGLKARKDVLEQILQQLPSTDQPAGQP